MMTNPTQENLIMEKEQSEIHVNDFIDGGGVGNLACKLMLKREISTNPAIYESILEKIETLSKIKTQDSLNEFCKLIEHNELILIHYSKKKDNGKVDDKLVYKDGGFYFYRAGEKNYVQPGKATIYAINCIKRFIGQKRFTFERGCKLEVIKRVHSDFELLKYEYVLTLTDEKISMNYQFFLGCHFPHEKN